MHAHLSDHPTHSTNQSSAGLVPHARRICHHHHHGHPSKWRDAEKTHHASHARSTTTPEPNEVGRLENKCRYAPARDAQDRVDVKGTTCSLHTHPPTHFSPTRARALNIVANTHTQELVLNIVCTQTLVLCVCAPGKARNLPIFHRHYDAVRSCERKACAGRIQSLRPISCNIRILILRGIVCTCVCVGWVIIPTVIYSKRQMVSKTPASTTL